MEYREIIDILDVTTPKREPKIIPLRRKMKGIEPLRLSLGDWRDTLGPREGIKPGKVTACVPDNEFLLRGIVEQWSAQVRRIIPEPATLG